MARARIGAAYIHGAEARSVRGNGETYSPAPLAFVRMMNGCAFAQHRELPEQTADIVGESLVGARIQELEHRRVFFSGGPVFAMYGHGQC